MEATQISIRLLVNRKALEETANVSPSFCGATLALFEERMISAQSTTGCLLMPACTSTNLLLRTVGGVNAFSLFYTVPTLPLLLDN